MRSNLFGFVGFLIVIILAIAANAEKVQKVQYVRFEPMVITATAKKVKRCTICNFRRPLVITGRIQRKLTRREKTMLADALASVREVVAKITAPRKIEIASK